MASSDVTASLTIKFDSVRGKSIEITQITGPGVGLQIFFRDKNPRTKSQTSRTFCASVQAFLRSSGDLSRGRRASLVLFAEIIVTLTTKQIARNQKSLRNDSGWPVRL